LTFGSVAPALLFSAAYICCHAPVSAHSPAVDDVLQCNHLFGRKPALSPKLTLNAIQEPRVKVRMVLGEGPDCHQEFLHLYRADSLLCLGFASGAPASVARRGMGCLGEAHVCKPEIAAGAGQNVVAGVMLAGEANTEEFGVQLMKPGPFIPLS
jgi:hypothetical protein